MIHLEKVITHGYTYIFSAEGSRKITYVTSGHHIEKYDALASVHESIKRLALVPESLQFMWELIVAIGKLLYSFAILIGSAILVIPQMIIALLPAWLKLGGSDLIATKVISLILIALLAGAGVYVGQKAKNTIMNNVSAIIGVVSLLLMLAGVAAQANYGMFKFVFCRIVKKASLTETLQIRPLI